MPRLNDATVSAQVGEVMKTLREKRGISRVDLARAMDISEVALHHYEKGNRRITLDTLLMVSGLLNKPMSFFLKEVDLTGAPQPLPSSAKASLAKAG